MRLQIYLNVQVDLPYNLINMYINVSLRDTSLGVKIQNLKRHDFLGLTKKTASVDELAWRVSCISLASSIYNNVGPLPSD